MEAARLSLESGISTRVLCESAHLSPASDMACNDSMNVLCEALTPEQARLLAELEQTGKLHAALVFRGDSTQAGRFLEEQQRVLEELYAEEPEETEGEEGAEGESPADGRKCGGRCGERERGGNRG